MTYAIRDRIPGGEYGRLCDVCARYTNTKNLRRLDNLWVCDRHQGYVPRRILEQRPLIRSGPLESLKDAKPYLQLPTYESTELEILKFVTEWPVGSDTFDVRSGGLVTPSTAGIAATAWTGIYLYSLLAEDKRPYRWMTIAKKRLGEAADWLISKQNGGGIASNPNDEYGSAYGGIEHSLAATDLFDMGTYLLDENAAAGICLLRAYQQLGDTKYLDAARRSAWFMRTMQCGHLCNQASSTTASGTPAYYWGAHSNSLLSWEGMIVVEDYLDHRYYPSGMIAAQFLKLFMAQVGDETIGSPVAISGFPASRAKLLSACIDDAVNFWRLGVAGVSGFSAETPREFFNSYPSAKYRGALTGTGAWAFSDGVSQITGANWAMGVRMFHEAGETATASAAFDYLMSYSSSATYELPAATSGRVVSGYDDASLSAGLLGTYSPKHAVAETLDTATATNASAIQDLGASGLMSPLYATKHGDYFADLKWHLSQRQPTSQSELPLPTRANIHLCLLGKSGLSWQPYSSTALRRDASIYQAALLGLAFRESPAAFGGRGIKE